MAVQCTGDIGSDFLLFRSREKVEAKVYRRRGTPLCRRSAEWMLQGEPELFLLCCFIGCFRRRNLCYLSNQLLYLFLATECRYTCACILVLQPTCATIVCTDTYVTCLRRPLRHTEPVNAEVLYSIADWEQKDFEDYALQTKQDDIRPLLAFIAMGIISLIIFLVWRVLRCCCRCCCLRNRIKERKQQKEGSGYAMTRRSYVGAQTCKGFMLLLFLGLLALTIWGLTSVDRGLADDAFDTIDAPFDYADEVKAEVDSAGKPLEAIMQEKVPETQRIVRVSMNDDTEPSSTAFRDALERSKSLVDQLYDNSTTPNPSSAADSLEALVEGAQRQQQYIDMQDSQVVGLEQNVSNMANFDSSKLPTAREYSNLETDLDTVIANPSTANKNGLRDKLNAIEGSTSNGDISSLHDSLEQISRLDLDALESSSAEAASPPSSRDGSLEALRANLRTLYEIATELSVDASTGTQQMQQGLLPFIDARLMAIGQDVVGLTAEVMRSQRVLYSLNTDLVAMHGSGVGEIISQLPQSIYDDPVGDEQMLDSLRKVSGRLSGDAGDILAYVSAVREMLNDFGPVRNTLDGHDANQITDAALEDRLGVFKDRVTAARSGQQNTDFAGFQAEANNAQQNAQTAEQSYNQNVRDNLLSRQQTYKVVNQDMQQQQPPTPSATISSTRGVASAAFPQQEFIPIEGLVAALEVFLSQASTVGQEAANVQRELQNINDEVDSVLDVGPIKTVRDNIQPDADYYNDLRYRVNMALYGLAAIFGLVLLVVCLVDCPAGIGIMIVIVLLYVIFFFILATAAGAILTAERDGCVNAEALIENELDNDYQPLFRYYFEGKDNTVRNILKEAGIVDLDSITAEAEGFFDQLDGSVEPFKPTGDLKNTLAEIEAEGQRMQDNVNGIVAELEREPVMDLYNKPKCFVCKDAFDEFARVWYMLTFAGWLLMVMTWFANGLLGELDKVPRANACCPCACLRHMPVGPRDEEAERSGDSGDEKGGFMGSKVAPVPLSMETSEPSQVDTKKVQAALREAATSEPDENVKSKVSTRQGMPSVATNRPDEDVKPRVSALPPIRLPSLPRG